MRALDPRQAIGSLQHSAFRWFVLGRIAGSPTGPMRSVAQGWLMYSLTGSALALGWMTAARALIMLIAAPIGGVLADRLEKRVVLLMARAVLVSTSLAVVILFFTGHLQPWHIVAAAMLEGIAFALMDPAMTGLITELVDRQTLLNAFSIVAVVEGIMGVIGATLAGLTIELVGAGGVYLIMTVLFLFASYTHLRLPAGVIGNVRSGAMHSDLAAGWRYLRTSPVLLALFGVVFVRMMLSQPFNSFLPAFARSTLGFDAAGLGLLTSASGAGALVSSLLIAGMGNPRRQAHMMVGAGIAAAMAVFLFMNVRVLPTTFVLIALAGACANAADVFTRTLVQAECRPAFRGRVTSLTMMLYSTATLITLPAGAVADRLGVPVVVSALAACIIAVQIVIAPKLLRSQRSQSAGGSHGDTI
jgi:MFS family permease